MSSPDLPGPSARALPRHRSPPDPNIIARSSWLLTRLFPDFSQIFLHTLLETRDFDLLLTLVDLLQKWNVPCRGVAPSISFYPGIHNCSFPGVLADTDFKAHRLVHYHQTFEMESHKLGPEKGWGVGGGGVTNPVSEQLWLSYLAAGDFFDTNLFAFLMQMKAS